jgi:predicted RNase H-like HicB family nuclease
MKFLIAIEPGTGTTAYGVVVPDLPGCFSAGDTLEEAFDNAREAIDAHCEFLAEDGRDVPLPAAMAAHQSNPDYAGWVWAMVDVAVESYWGPAEKVNITLPGRTLRRIDEYARAHGQTRSGFLAEAARQAMR